MKHFSLFVAPCCGVLCCGVLCLGGCAPAEEKRIPAKVALATEYQPFPDQWPDQVHRIAAGTPVVATVYVRLAAGDRLMLRTDEEWHPTTLAQFSKRLKRENTRMYKERKAAGTPVEESLGRKLRPALFVEIGVHATSKWEHVLWLLNECAVRAIDKVQLRSRGRTVRLYLSWDAAICGVANPPPDNPDFWILNSQDRAMYLADLRDRVTTRDKTWKIEHAKFRFVPVFWADRTLTADQMVDCLEMLIEAGTPRVLFREFREHGVGGTAPDNFVRCRDIARREHRTLSVLPSR